MLRRRRRVDLRHRGEQRAVEVAAAEQRQHVLVEDLLLLGVVEERRPEARAAVQDHLAVLVARVHVEQDHEAVVEALPPDAPLVHQRPGVGVGLLGRPAVLDGLGVDHDLGAGPLLDLADRLRDAIDRVRAEDAGGVVDADAVLRLGEGRSRGERRQQPGPGGRQRRTRRRRRRGRRRASAKIGHGQSLAERRHATAAPAELERAVRPEDHLRRPRPAVVGRAEARGVGAGVADRDEVAAAERRQRVLAELVGRFADRAVDGGLAELAGGRRPVRPRRPAGRATSARRSGGGRRTARAG